MTKEELYKVSDILNDVLSTYLRGSETEEVLSRFEESISNSDMLQEKYNITGIKSRHATGKLKECIDNQTEEGFEQARKQLQENPQECMYTKDNYTDEDRKVLCDVCEEKCEYAQKEDVWWLQELHNKLDSLSKEDFEKVWAKYHQKEESVSEDLEDEITRYCNPILKELRDTLNKHQEYVFDLGVVARHFAEWQKQQMMKDAVESSVAADLYGLNIGIKCNPDKFKFGEKVKIIVLKV